MNVSSPLQSSIETTQQWLNEIGDLLETDDETAYGALRGTLHTLRDSLTVDEAAHLGAQLPAVIRGFYYTGWRPSQEPIRRDATEFIEAVRESAGLGDSPHPLAAARAVMDVMSRRITAGELDDVLRQLPEETARALMPQEAD